MLDERRLVFRGPGPDDAHGVGFLRLYEPAVRCAAAWAGIDLNGRVLVMNVSNHNRVCRDCGASPLELSFELRSVNSPVWLFVPFLSPLARARRSIKRQLRRRSEDDLIVWAQHRGSADLRKRLSPFIRDVLGWPNDFFLPDDPFRLLILEDIGLGDAEVFRFLHEECGLSDEMENRLMPGISNFHLTYGELIEVLSTGCTGLSAGS